jgi:hypothetical protein
MNFPLPQTLFFALAISAGMAMVAEGCSIVLLKRLIIPLPTRLLYGMGMLVVGAEKSRRQFLKRTSPKNLHTYAVCTLVFGPLMLVSSFVYLFTSIL